MISLFLFDNLNSSSYIKLYNSSIERFDMYQKFTLLMLGLAQLLSFTAVNAMDDFDKQSDSTSIRGAWPSNVPMPWISERFVRAMLEAPGSYFKDYIPQSMEVTLPKDIKEMICSLVLDSTEIERAEEGIGDDRVTFVLKSNYSEGVKKQIIYNLSVINGCDINGARFHGFPLITEMTLLGDTESVRGLIASGANVEPDCKGYFGPLFYAAYLGYADIVTLLLKAGACPQSLQNRLALFYATVLGYPEIVKLLVEYKAERKGYYFGMMPLHMAAVHSTPRHHEVLKELLTDFEAIDLPCISTDVMQGATPLFLAALVGNAEAVELLLHVGANPNICRKDGMTPLWAAVQEGHMKVVELLLNHEAATDPWNGITPLAKAIEKGHVKVAELLASFGAQAGAQNAQLIERPLSGGPETLSESEAAEAAKS